MRTVRVDDLARLREIELAAGQLFRQVGMVEIADDPPPSIDTLTTFQRAGRGWVAVDDNDVPIAFILVEPVDGNAHIAQVSVDPEHSRRGVGGALIELVDGWAADRGMPALTLTTFRDVPWNAPYYERLGFRIVIDPPPGLAGVIRHETDIGLDPTTRVAMRRNIGAGESV